MTDGTEVIGMVKSAVVLRGSVTGLDILGDSPLELIGRPLAAGVASTDMAFFRESARGRWFSLTTGVGACDVLGGGFADAAAALALAS